MRPQARPFMVETKSRRRATQPENSASFTRRDDWLDLVPPDELPEQDVNEDLGVAPPHEAFREAEKVFARIGKISAPVEANDAPPAPVTIAPARRVLPDLLAAAREEERVSIRLPKTKRAAMGTPTTSRRTKADHQPVAPSVQTVEVQSKASLFEIPTGHAEAAIVLSRRTPRRSKFPPGQGWKARRLPKVCWARKLSGGRS
jgi:hypothetical protein